MLFFVAACLLLYFLLPLTLNFLASCLVRRDSLTSSDIAISLGGGRDCLRHLYAAELYRRGLAKKVVLTGLNFTQGDGEEKTARRYLTNLGVAEADIVLLKNMYNTRKEAEALAQLMREQGWKSALIVTDPYHTRRARYTIQRASPELLFFAAPLPAGPHVWQPERWWTRRGDMYATVREGLAWANTLVGGLR